ncbi:MAG: hypothetical protein ACLQU1_20300, partial [Bryobacteraceae bacterium]
MSKLLCVRSPGRRPPRRGPPGGDGKTGSAGRAAGVPGSKIVTRPHAATGMRAAWAHVGIGPQQPRETEESFPHQRTGGAVARTCARDPRRLASPQAWTRTSISSRDQR